MAINKRHIPPHPGSLLRNDVLPALALTVTEAARQLGVSRSALSRLINERAAITVNMVARLEQWLPGPTAGKCAHMQIVRGLWEFEQRGLPKIFCAAPRLDPTEWR